MVVSVAPSPLPAPAAATPALSAAAATPPLVAAAFAVPAATSFPVAALAALPVAAAAALLPVGHSSQSENRRDGVNKNTSDIIEVTDHLIRVVSMTTAFPWCTEHHTVTFDDSK